MLGILAGGLAAAQSAAALPTGISLSLPPTAMQWMPARATVSATGGSFDALDWVSFYDVTDSAHAKLLATCHYSYGTSTTCSADLTLNTLGFHVISAYVSRSGGSFNPPATTPPPSVYQALGVVIVTPFTLEFDQINDFTVDRTTTAVNNTVKLTVSAYLVTGHRIEIFDTTAGRLNKSCTTSPCTLSILSRSELTHGYRAYITSSYTTSYPPSGVQARSSLRFVTWSNAGVSISLSAWDTLTASASIPWADSSREILIYNAETGRLFASGSPGQTYLTNIPLVEGTPYVAFWAPPTSATAPPANATASSQVVSYTRQPH